MKNYRFIDGISIVKVCDYYLIVSTTIAWKDVCKIEMVSKIGILALAMLIDGIDKNKIIYHLSKCSKQPKEKIKASFESMVENLITQGFLIEGD